MPETSKFIPLPPENPYKSVEQLSRFIAESKHPVEWETIIESHPDARVVAIGENHETLQHRDFLKNSLYELHSRGMMTHLLLESFPADDNVNLLVSQWLTTEKKWEELVDEIVVQYNPSIFEEINLKRFGPVLEEVRRLNFEEHANLTVVGIDLPHKNYPKEASEREIVQMRDELMANQVKKILSSNPDNHVVLYGGRFHMSRDGVDEVTDNIPTDTVVSRLREEHIDVNSIRLSGGIKNDQGLLEDAAKIAYVADEFFLLPVTEFFNEGSIPTQYEGENTTLHVNWAIHFPQTGEFESSDQGYMSISF